MWSKAPRENKKFLDKGKEKSDNLHLLWMKNNPNGSEVLNQLKEQN